MNDSKFYRVAIQTIDHQLRKGDGESKETIWLCPDTGLVFQKSLNPGEERIFHISNMPGSNWWVVPSSVKPEVKTFDELIRGTKKNEKY
jgi:hypothetical protein